MGKRETQFPHLQMQQWKPSLNKNEYKQQDNQRRTNNISEMKVKIFF